ncbi:hypothetical protein [Nocardia sp. NPDC059239]|uniref:hypothetical protein n=1 Tax=unclassified Nocardia TaxID=2637762 RepID=UPI00369F71A7
MKIDPDPVLIGSSPPTASVLTGLTVLVMGAGWVHGTNTPLMSSKRNLGIFDVERYARFAFG